MDGFFVALFQVFMVSSLFCFIPFLLVLRVLFVRKNKYSFKKVLAIIFCPFSIAYYFVASKNETKIYNKIIILFTVITIIGMMFTLFQRLVSNVGF